MNATALSIAAATAGLAAGGYAYAAMWPTSQIFGHTIVAGHDPDEIAPTYDDGPNPVYTPQLLDLLDRYAVKATFFLIGNHVQRHPQIAQEIVQRGHLVGNHTQTHPKLLFCSPARVRRELSTCQQAIYDATGVLPTLFRPPHGARRPDVLRTARILGLTPVLWNITAKDWSPIGAEGITRNIEAALKRNRTRTRGSNILLHDGSQLDAPNGVGPSRQDTLTATANLLQSAAARKLRFVTIDRWQSNTSISTAGISKNLSF